MSEQSAAGVPAAPGRMMYLDLFRGLAVFFMFDAHVTDALVKLGPGASRIHQWHNLTFNLPAPAFLFAAGLSFGMTVYSRWEQLHLGFVAARSRLARIAEVLFIAYLLHAPATSLSASLAAPPSAMRRFLGWDILQCIGYTLLLLLCVALVSPRRQWFVRIAIAFTLIISFASAWLWDIQWDTASATLPWWIATIFSKQLGSNFPFFPYAVFLTAGAVWGYYFSQARESGAHHRFLKQTLQRGAGLMLLCLLLTKVPLPPPYNDFWGGSPVFIYLRIGLLMAILAALYFLEAVLLPALGFIVTLGRESLMVYFVHLLIVYGSPVTSSWSLRAQLPGGIGFWTWLTLLASLTLTMTVFAWLWTHLKQRLGAKLDRVLWLAAAVATAIFLSR